MERFSEKIHSNDSSSSDSDNEKEVKHHSTSSHKGVQSAINCIFSWRKHVHHVLGGAKLVMVAALYFFDHNVASQLAQQKESKQRLVTLRINASAPELLYRSLDAKFVVGMSFKDLATVDLILLRELPPVEDRDDLFAIFTIDESTPGLKAIFNFVVTNQRSGKVELRYQHDYSGISASIGLTSTHVVNFSGVVGTPLLSFGTDLFYDIASGNLTKCNDGVSFANADLIAAVTLNNKGQNINASYYHIVSPLTNTVVGVELAHSFSTNENTLTIGTQKDLDPLTVVNSRINNHGKASALIQHEWRPKFLFTI